ncbi:MULTISPECIES: copper resistance protein B [unclassified Novosphingobium]|mgnify:CR=1 FL=1|uniref:copper resistance protein B n=1 Tax=unclassified Novosphingobium TaxID=2644732 RepID=UPI00086AF535|nr:MULTISPECIES: copper resistance protein B [unclassified Novosphingobium]MBN9142465.1 copper resistance protein B [Novosphingobium sp.]ODU76525.1 MAG: copper resistance protein CopB [Novosphingobium sp. SCN 63-17]OJX97586.1 MAG: copper resistance protein CopB [Novosphingobium sp. 63-713]
MSTLRTALMTAATLGLSAPASAQDHSMDNMPGMDMPAAKKAVPKKAKTSPAKPQRETPASVQKPSSPGALPSASEVDHSKMNHGPTSDTVMDHGTMGEMPMPAAESEGGPEGMAMSGTALPPGSAPPPPFPTDRYADRHFPPGEMARAHAEMMKESGGLNFGAALLNIAEYQAHRGRDGYRWDGEAWYGGDINRLWIKSEGEGELRRGLDSGDVQLLYSHAIDPYFNLQAGVRQDIGPSPRRTYATIGFEGLAPGMFEVEGGVFLSNKGEVIGRVEGYYDQRITQRLVFQPRVELNFSAQDMPEIAIGSGLSNVELGARLRYEIKRQFAPYIGVSYYRKLGDTASYARARGEDVHATSFVAGVRFWF